ncbi:MAG: response regulator [Gammaproteobacteria bacterium]|nr:response regulator [Gammaproteobacteria bacterium]
MQSVLTLLVVASMVLVLVTDLVTPQGFAHGTLYLLPVAFAYFLGSRRLLLATTAVAVVLLWIGAWWSPPGMAFAYFLSNRLVSTLLLMALTLLLLWLMQKADAAQRIQHALSEFGLGVFVTDAGGRLTWSNDALARLEGDAPTRVIVPDGPAQTAEIRSVLDAAGNVRDLRRRIRAVENSQGMLFGYVGLVESVTPGDVWHQTLSEVRVGHAAVLESISEAILAVDAKWRVTYVNRAAEQLLRDDRSQLLGQPLEAIYPGVMQSPIGALYREAFERCEFRRIEAHFERIDAWLDVRVFPHHQGVTFIFRDVSEDRELRLTLERAELESRSQAVLLRAVIDGLTEGLLVVDADRRLLLMNAVAERYLGPFSESDMALPLDERESLYLADEVTLVPLSEWPMSRALEGSPIDEVRLFLRNALHPDGIPLRVSARPLWEEGRVGGRITGAITWFRDISDLVAEENKRREIEEELRHAQRLEAMGQLTGGVAHDFNNLLTVIVGNADLLVGTPDLDPENDESARMILAAAEKASRLVQQLLAFSRRQPLAPEAFDPVERLHTFLPLLQRTLGETIHLSLTGETGKFRAVADPTQLESAVLNLCVNARDAMPDGGPVRIEVGLSQLTEEEDDLPAAVEPGDFVAVRVVDEGSGMPEEVLERALEPFFTTKEVGHGSGLGLSMVFGFVRQSLGHLRMTSELGRGTAIEMLLPLATAGQQGSVAVQEQSSLRSLARERVLVVEDDPMVCDLIRLTLEELGYRAQIARTGEQALERAAGQNIDVLLTDLVLPGAINGMALAESLRREHPDLRVLLMTGYGAEVSEPGNGDSILRKPFRRGELAARLREVLGNEAPGGA